MRRLSEMYCPYVPLSANKNYPEPAIEYTALTRLVLSYTFKYKIELLRDQFERSILEIAIDLWYSGININFEELVIKKNGQILLDGDKIKRYRLYGHPPILNGRTIEDVVLPLSMMNLEKMLPNGNVLNLEFYIKDNQHQYFKQQPYTSFIKENMVINSNHRIELDKETFNDYVHILKDGINL